MTVAGSRISDEVVLPLRVPHLENQCLWLALAIRILVHSCQHENP